MDRNGLSGSGGKESSDEWRSLFEMSKGSEVSKSSKMKGALNLDLTNFEEPGAEGSRYVLTSPRSLEACARFGVKPVELLHKSYEEFIDEFKALYDTNYSHEAIFEVFQEHERQRKRKLRLCQEERDRIMRDQERRERDVIEDFTKGTHQSTTKQLHEVNESRQNDFTKTTSSPTSQQEHESKGNRWKSTRYSSSPDLNGSRGHFFARSSSPNQQEEEPKDNRWRSARYSSSPERIVKNGHQETSGRSKITNGHQETSGRSKITKSQSFSASRGARSRGESSDSDTADSISRPHVRRVRSQWSIPKTGSLPGSPRLARRDSESNTGSLSRLTAKPEKPQSRAMSTDCILTAVGGNRLSNTDQKIIDLMLTRHEEAQQLRSDKMMLDLEWDDQRRLENDLRQSRVKQRSAELYEQYTAKDIKQMEVRARKDRKEQRLKREKEEAIRAKQLLWEQEKQKQQQSLANKIELKRLAEAEKKRQQEEKRRQKEREDEMNRNVAYLSLLEKHEKAMKNRSRKATHEQFKLQNQNESEKAKIMEKREEVEKRKTERKVHLKSEMTEKHRRAIENYEDVLNRREDEIRDSKRKKREKVFRQREQLSRMESELSDWQKNLKEYQRESLKRAEAISAMNVTKKQLKVRSHLTSKQTEHAENLERVKEEEKRRTQELLQQIEVKDEKSEMVNMEKEEVRKISREAAQSSQAVRSLIKEKTYKRSFDRMARAAEVRANIGRGPRKAYRNQSTVMLG